VISPAGWPTPGPRAEFLIAPKGAAAVGVLVPLILNLGRIDIDLPITGEWLVLLRGPARLRFPHPNLPCMRDANEPTAISCCLTGALQGLVIVVGITRSIVASAAVLCGGASNLGAQASATAAGSNRIWRPPAIGLCHLGTCNGEPGLVCGAA
jgi:hypothetical protein